MLLSDHLFHCIFMLISYFLQYLSNSFVVTVVCVLINWIRTIPADMFYHMVVSYHYHFLCGFLKFYNLYLKLQFGDDNPMVSDQLIVKVTFYAAKKRAFYQKTEKVRPLINSSLV